jgi:hypothetical protein
VLEITSYLPKGQPISIYKHPKQIELLYPFTGRFLGRPDVSVETDQTRCTASDRPTPSMCSPKFNYDRSILQRSLRANGQTQSTGRAAQTTGRAERTASRAREASTGRAHATIGRNSASVRSQSREVPESSFCDRTRIITCDRTHRASD